MSPGFTNTSMTGTSLKSPMSGTRTSIVGPAGGVALAPSPGMSARPFSPRGGGVMSSAAGGADAVPRRGATLGCVAAAAPSPAATPLPLPRAGEGWGEGCVASVPRAGERCDEPCGVSRAGAPASVSSVNTTLPSLTLSPTLTPRFFTVPAAGDGTSIVALSDSSVTSESSTATRSPGLTSTSMTGTSLKSPMSGTLTSMVLMVKWRARRVRC